MRFRLIPLVTVLLMLTFTVRLGDFAVQLALGEDAHLQKSEAFAEDEVLPKPEDAAKSEDEKAVEAKPEEAKPVEEAKEDDPFVPEFSEEEIKVLQSLSKRREQIDQRERDIEQREKLLKAAEKKIDEKVVELAGLKTQLETLLDNQEKQESESIAQLVKIYESMKPKDAANIFNEMDFDVLLKIINAMSERRVAPVLAAMNAGRARELSRHLAESRALPKKADPEAAN
jgi:flagellar motility protein MotE (MotC chaperone)